MSLRGSVCLYQGEELGLSEAELAFEDLQDPYGIRFWPEFKGRDGCRTPMVWDDTSPMAASRRRSRGCRCRRTICRSRSTGSRATRTRCSSTTGASSPSAASHPALAKGDIEFLAAEGDAIAFTRREGNEQIVCAFNLGSTPAILTLGAGKKAQPLGGQDFPATGFQERRKTARS